MTWAERVTLDYAVDTLKQHGITIYNPDGTARPADQVLLELVRAYIGGNLNLTK